MFNRQRELPRYSRAWFRSPRSPTRLTIFNLNIPRYIKSSEPEDLHDLDAHLNGGIPDRDIDALGDYWTIFPSLRNALFEGNGRAGYSETRVETQQLKAAVLGHGEFESYADRVSAIFKRLAPGS